MLDRSGKFRVTVGPLGRETFERFLEGSPNADRLRELVRSYVTDPLDFDVEILLAPGELVPLVLGEQSARLGQTASLGECAQRASEARTILEDNGKHQSPNLDIKARTRSTERRPLASDVWPPATNN